MCLGVQLLVLLWVLKIRINKPKKLTTPIDRANWFNDDNFKKIVQEKKYESIIKNYYENIKRKSRQNLWKEAIKRQNLSEEFYSPDNCYITVLSNSPEDPDLSIARVRLKPGVTTSLHRLIRTSERYYIVSGKGYVEVGKLPPQEVNVGDIVFIPPMCPQRIQNIGFEDLVFLAICTPRFSSQGNRIKIL